jgi:hypothetical protein
MWNNHVKSEKLDDESMGKLIAAYEEFGWNTIWHEPNAGFASDKQNPEQIVVDEDQAGELIVPDGSWRVSYMTGGGRELAYIHDDPESKKKGCYMFRGPGGNTRTLSDLRNFILTCMEKDIIFRVQSYDKDHKPIGLPGRKA